MPASKHFNPEGMRFQDKEQNFRAQLNMPKQEKLVNCVWVWEEREGHVRPPIGVITRGCGHQRVLSSEGVVTRKLECQSNMAAEYITLTTPTKAHQFSLFMNIKDTFELIETLTKIAI